MIIYKATNKLDGKFYVGSTKNSLQHRKSQHEFLALKNPRIKFQYKLRDIGVENFVWEVLFDSFVDEIEMRKKEEEIINETKCHDDQIGYNIATKTSIVHSSSKETKERIKKLLRTPWAKVKKCFDDSGYEVLLTEDRYESIGKQSCETICPKGHKYKVKLYAFLKGNRCEKCMRVKSRINIEHIRNTLSKEDYELLINENEYYDENNRKLLIPVKCSAGHISNINFWNFKKGHRCKKCYLLIPKSHSEQTKKKMRNNRIGKLNPAFIKIPKNILNEICILRDEGLSAYMIHKKLKKDHNIKFSISTVRERMK